MRKPRERRALEVGALSQIQEPGLLFASFHNFLQINRLQLQPIDWQGIAIDQR